MKYGDVRKFHQFVFIWIMLFESQSVLSAADYCYEVRWQLSQPNPKRQLMRPATRFPSSHSVVQHPVCGTRAAGSTIPPVGQHSQSGGAGGCQSLDAGALFYAYDYPYSASSNTGYEQKETDLMFFVLDSDNNAYYGKQMTAQAMPVLP